VRAIFECVALAIKNKGIKGLGELVPGGQYLIDVCGEAFKLWRERRRDAKLRDELDRVAAASADEARKTAEEVARQVMGEERSEDEAVLGLYLAQIPGAVRASLRRADDPTGRTVPPELAVDTPEELARLLPQRAPRFRAGTDLPGRSGWQLEELLGAGGFGEVWLVRHTFIPQARAVKFCTEPQLRSRLMSHEGKVVSRVMGHRNHPNVVALLDALLEGETPWLMYEYVGGGDLTELIHEWQRLAPVERQRLTVLALQQLAGAVGTFHRLAPPIVHRDLKPANILVESAHETRDIRLTVELKITDFGISGVAAELGGRAGLPAATMMTGILDSSLRGSFTPLYASPQQRAGNPPDPRDDVHALGVIGFHIMTGRLTEAPGIDAVDDLRDAGAGEELTAILARCIATKADRRPADAAELADQLRAVAGAGRAARTTAPAEKQTTARPQKPRDTAPRTDQPPLFEAQKQGSLFSDSGKGGEPSSQPAPTRCVVPVRGLWLSRPFGSPRTAWPGTGTKVPSEVTANPAEVYLLKLNPETATDAELAKLRTLAGFPGLEGIDLTACKFITDVGLLHLANVPGLMTVILTDTVITDAGLARLVADQPDLERIDLRGATHVTPAVIPDLMRLRNLSHLALPPRLDTVDIRVELARRRPACQLA
jgi:eukaryotic-like serine/threonine-protein kinase